MSYRCVDAHKFAKFDDARLFCRRCGEQRLVDPRPWWYATSSIQHAVAGEFAPAEGALALRTENKGPNEHINT